MESLICFQQGFGFVSFLGSFGFSTVLVCVTRFVWVWESLSFGILGFWDSVFGKVLGTRFGALVGHSLVESSGSRGGTPGR